MSQKMKKDSKTFASGDLVFARVRGYPAWPARVTCPADKNSSKFHVFFYGTHETGICKTAELWLYDAETKAKFGGQKRRFFAEALDEIENRPEIAIADSAAELSQTDDAMLGALSLEEDGVVIVESDKGSKKNSKNRGSKHKADESPATPLQPPAKQIRTKFGECSTTPAENSTPTTTLSKSGRIIKSKKFVDESPTAGNDHGEIKIKKKYDPLRPEPNVTSREMFVHVKETGEFIKINLDKGRPEKFSSAEEESIWESATARNAAIFIEQLNSGKFVPIELIDKLKLKENRTPGEDLMIKNQANRLEKIRWLKIEQKLVETDADLKRALSIKQPNMEESLKLLRDLQSLSVCAFMFKKQPVIVQTIRLLQKYCGPATPSPDPKVNESWASQSEGIRNEATKVYSKIRSLFVIPSGKNFLETFDAEVKAYREAAKNIPMEKLQLLVKDPTKTGNS